MEDAGSLISSSLAAPPRADLPSEGCEEEVPRGPRTISPSPLRSLPRPGPCSQAPFVWNSVYLLFYSLFQLLVSCVVFTSASSNRQAGAHGGLLDVVPGAGACSCTPGRQEAPACPSSARWRARLKWSPWGGLRCGACWERPPWAQRAMRSCGGAATHPLSPRPPGPPRALAPGGLADCAAQVEPFGLCL